MKYVSLIIIIFSTTLSSQTILNSEKVLSKIDSVLVVGIGLDGDFSKGNINLVQKSIKMFLEEYLIIHIHRKTKRYFQMIGLANLG